MAIRSKGVMIPFRSGMTPPDESGVDTLVKIKGGISQKTIMQKAHDMERDRQYFLMDLLYGNAGHKSKLASGR